MDDIVDSHFWAGFAIAAVICIAAFCVYLMVDFNRTHLYKFGDRTCVVQWATVSTCYPTPGVE